MLLNNPLNVNGLLPPLKIRVEVPPSNVISDLTDFPLMIDLKSMPSAFWNKISSSGSNLKALSADGVTYLPMDITNLNAYQKQGRIFVKQTLSSSVPTDIWLYVFNSPGALYSSTSPLGRNAVWEDYEAVVVFPQELDRTGKNSVSNFDNEPTSRWSKQAFGGLTGDPHQGVTTDGVNFWSADTNAIRRMNMSFVVQNSDTDIATSVAAAGGPTISHLGDPVVVGNRFFITATHSRSGGGNYHRYILEFNATTLALVTYTEIGDTSTTNHLFGATVCYDGTNLVLFSYTDGSKIRKFTLDGVFVEEIPLSSSLGKGTQGSTVLPNGNFMVTNDTYNNCYEIEPDGTILGITYQDPHTDIDEGLAYDNLTDTLYLLKGDGDLVTLKTNNGEEDWSYLHFDSSTLTLATSFSDVYTLSGSFKWLTGSTDIQGSFFSASSSLTYDEGPDLLGTYTAANGWLHSAKNPSYNEIWHGAIQYDDATSRAVWINGVKSEEISSSVAMPAVTGISIGDDDLQTSSQFIWLRNEKMSDAWMEADYLNRNDPASFYTVHTT